MNEINRGDNSALSTRNDVASSGLSTFISTAFVIWTQVMNECFFTPKCKQSHCVQFTTVRQS